MTGVATGRDAKLRGIHVLDGGLATELEYQGARIDGPLWSAHVLEDEPEKLSAVHRAYIEAGAECIATCSYQVSRKGYAEVGFTAERADRAFVRSVELARAAIAEFPGRRLLVAGSLGPYGAALHNGGEYHGNYDCTFDDLVRFHRERIEIFAHASGRQRPDLLAFETFPSLEEARAVGAALAPWPELQAWFSFSCRDEKHVSHGERVADCAALVASFPQTVAIGVNCVPPQWIPSLIAELRAASTQAGAGLSQLRQWMGCGAALLDWNHRSDRVWSARCRVVSRGSADRGRMLPHAAGAHTRRSLRGGTSF